MVRQHALDPDRMEAIFAELAAQAHGRARRAGLRRRGGAAERSADLRYFGQAFEVRVPVARRADRPGVAPPPWRTRSTHAHRALYGYDFRADARQQVEWVNLG